MQNELRKPWVENNKEKLVLGIFILLKLIICAWPYEYGYFCDELYYIALSHHLDWGYVDVPPLLPLCIFLLRHTVGNSLFVLHLFSAMFGVLFLIITWLMVKKMGGKFFAQVIMLTCLTFAPFAEGNLLIYTTLCSLFWVLSLYFVVSLLVSENKKYWIYFGIAAGLGLMSKFDMLWLGSGITVALLLTSQRKYFVCRQFWIGGLIALIIASPYLVWIATHDFITWEFLSNYSSAIMPTGIFEFFKTQIIWLNVFAFPIWAFGFYYFLFNKNGKKYRMLGITYLVLIALCRILNNKFYVILPFYTVLFAAGAIYIESSMCHFRKSKLLLSAYLCLIAALGIFLIPYVRPVLPPNLLPKYAEFVSNNIMSFHTHKSFEHYVIPQILYDRFGWEEVAAEVSRVYNSLSAEDKKSAIFGSVQSYVEAAAIDFYRGKYNLPPTLCGFLQYYLWAPKDLPAETIVITIGGRDEIDKIKKTFSEVKAAGIIHTECSISLENNRVVYVCKGFKIPPKEVLKKIRNMQL